MAFKLAVIGAGSAAAYYCASRLGLGLSESLRAGLEERATFVKPSLAKPKLGVLGSTEEENRLKYLNHLRPQKADFKDTVLIGGPGPWVSSPVVGRGGDYVIGHSPQTISMRPLFAFSPERRTAYMPRDEFNEECEAVIHLAERQGLVREHARVTALGFDSTSKLFTVSFAEEHGGTGSHQAENILLLTGVGDSIKPGPKTGIQVPPDWERMPQIMNLDEFMRHLATHGEQMKGKSICIQGANAAIDAVEQAHRFQCTVQWLLRDAPMMLPDSQLRFTPEFVRAEGGTYVHEGGTSQRHDGVRSVSITQHGFDQLRVTLFNKDQWKEERESSPLTVDYYVYSIGQDANLSPNGAIYLLTQGDAPIIPSRLVKADARGVSFFDDSALEPIYDEGWYFRELSGGRGAVEEAAIGMRKWLVREARESDSRRVDILGAASFMVLDIRGALMKKLSQTTNYQVASVFDVRQLGAIQHVVKAYCNALSGVSLDKESVNFIGMTKNELAAYIAMHHVFIPPVIANSIVNTLALRRMAPRFANGYKPEETARVQRALDLIDLYFEKNVEDRERLNDPSQRETARFKQVCANMALTLRNHLERPDTSGARL